jgi:hypothetical protein
VQAKSAALAEAFETAERKSRLLNAMACDVCSCPRPDRENIPEYLNFDFQCVD